VQRASPKQNGKVGIANWKPKLYCEVKYIPLIGEEDEEEQ
jgi:hypothetical protein